MPILYQTNALEFRDFLLFSGCHNSFATDTLIMRGGVLCGPIFRGNFFIRWRKNVEESIKRIYERDHRRVFLSPSQWDRTRVFCTWRIYI